MLTCEKKQELLKTAEDIKWDAKEAKDINDNPFNYEDERYKIWRKYFKSMSMSSCTYELD